MAAQQTISWIALPNGRLPNGDYRLSVFVSPRLSASSASATLNDFPDFVDWPKRLRQLTLRIGNRVGTSNSFGDFTTSFPKSEYWTALFPPSTRVRSFRFADRTSSPIVSYPVGPLLDQVNGQYGELASRFPDDLPSHEQMADPETGLQTPSLAVLTRGRSRDELLAEAAGLIAQHQPLPYSSPAREVVQALLFQRPRFSTARADSA